MMERRDERRIKIYAPVMFGREGDSLNKYGTVSDVSYHGVFIQSQATMQPGERITMELSLHGERIVMTGRIVRMKYVDRTGLVVVAKGGVGVAVDELHPALDDYISEHLVEIVDDGK